MTVRTASGPRYTRASDVTELDEELRSIRESPGLVEKAAVQVRRTGAVPARALHRGIRVGLARVRARAGTLAGLTGLSVAAFEVGTVPGLVVASFAAFLAEWVMK